MYFKKVNWYYWAYNEQSPAPSSPKANYIQFFVSFLLVLTNTYLNYTLILLF